MERVRAKLGDVSASVTLGDLQSFEALLAPLLPNTPPLRGPNQKEEPRPHRRPLFRPVPTQPPPERALPPLLDTGAFSTPLAADYLGLSPATLETLRSRGGGPPFVKLGRRVVYRREDLDAWLAASRRTSKSDAGSKG